MVLAVAVAVASNQILNSGLWSWWWTGIAVALTTISALITHKLTRPTAATPAATSGQVIEDSTAGTSIDQLRDITGSVRLHDTKSPAPAPAPSTAPAQPAAPGEAPPPADRETPADQRISGSQAGGSITQIHGVGGDVTIERS
ncbi:hypothetical protein J5X84_22560 [Streptosporangiaceae bacterium NEAU-GS5]|nr:hypothetical protein [Streptosporangiaceae bacterium NEAU-GS5]